MRKSATVLIVLVVVYGLLYLVPVDRSNPPVTAEISAPPQVASILERSCYDCHSNETKWPAYSYIVPVSWLVAHDVEEGRGKINFSTFGAMPPGRQLHAMKEILDEVQEGAMPLGKYVTMHKEAKLSPGDVQVLRNWVAAAGVPVDGGGGEEAGEHDGD